MNERSAFLTLASSGQRDHLANNCAGLDFRSLPKMAGIANANYIEAQPKAGVEVRMM